MEDDECRLSLGGMAGAANGAGEVIDGASLSVGVVVAVDVVPG